MGFPQWERVCLPVQELQGMRVKSLGRENPLEKEMTTCSSILSWEIPWTEEPGGLQSTGLQRDRHIFVTKQQLIQYDLILANYIGRDPISK